MKLFFVAALLLVVLYHVTGQVPKATQDQTNRVNNMNYRKLNILLTIFRQFYSISMLLNIGEIKYIIIIIIIQFYFIVLRLYHT